MKKLDLSDDSGLTLIELAISMGILGVIIGPIIIAMLMGLLTSGGTRDRIADASSAQFLSSFFPSDIQSAGSATTNGTQTTGIAFSGLGSCPTALPAGSTLKLNLTVLDPSAPTNPAKQTTILYYTKPAPSGGALELYRRQCKTSTSQDTTEMIVQHVDPGTDWNPACSLPVTTCQTVTVTFKAFNPASSSGYSGETYTVRGTRRITQ